MWSPVELFHSPNGFYVSHGSLVGLKPHFHKMGENLWEKIKKIIQNIFT
jgi:hypothetical protein